MRHLKECRMETEAFGLSISLDYARCLCSQRHRSLDLWSHLRGSRPETWFPVFQEPARVR